MKKHVWIIEMWADDGFGWIPLNTEFPTREVARKAIKLYKGIDVDEGAIEEYYKYRPVKKELP